MRHYATGKKMKICVECWGTGEVEVELVRGSGPEAYLVHRLDLCLMCGGSGEIEVEEDDDGDA